jgi:hypothetical protein
MSSRMVSYMSTACFCCSLIVSLPEKTKFFFKLPRQPPLCTSRGARTLRIVKRRLNGYFSQADSFSAVDLQRLSTVFSYITDGRTHFTLLCLAAYLTVLHTQLTPQPCRQVTCFPFDGSGIAETDDTRQPLSRKTSNVVSRRVQEYHDDIIQPVHNEGDNFLSSASAVL